MKQIIEQAKQLYALENSTFTPVSGHEGGRNQIVIVSHDGEKNMSFVSQLLGTEARMTILPKRSLSVSWRKTVHPLQT